MNIDAKLVKTLRDKTGFGLISKDSFFTGNDIIINGIPIQSNRIGGCDLHGKIMR